MGLRDYRLFLYGLLLLSTNCYANGESLHLPKDRDCEHKGFFKKAAHAALTHPTAQDLLKIFPFPRKQKRARPTISAPLNPRPQNNSFAAQENEYAEIDDLVTSPTRLTPPKPPKRLRLHPLFGHVNFTQPQYRASPVQSTLAPTTHFISCPQKKDCSSKKNFPSSSC